MKNYIVNLYISKRMDADLIDIICQVSPAIFNKIAKYALRSLFDSEYIAKTKQLYYDAVKKNARSQIDDSIILHLSITSQNDENVRFLLSKIKTRKRSSFIKQTIRYCLGAEIIFPVYLLQENILKSPNYSHLVLEGLDSPRTTYKRKAPAQKRSEKPSKETQSQLQVPVENIAQTSYKENIPDAADIKQIAGWESEDTVIPPVSFDNTSSASDDDDDILALLNNILG